MISASRVYELWNILGFMGLGFRVYEFWLEGFRFRALWVQYMCIM